MIDRAHLQEAIELITLQKTRFGEVAVATAVEVLEERLAALGNTPSERDSIESPGGEQRKQVTILFAALEGFTRLAGTARQTAQLRQIDLFWRRMDDTILEYGGLVDKHMGDVIMGIFGAPAAREDDPERAVRCAIALQDLVAEVNTRQGENSNLEADPDPQQTIFRIGINTGQVSLGQVGSDAGQTAIGDAVNVASRLKEAASESGIYISQDTYHLVRPLFRVESLGEVSIKGRRTPVNVYKVTGSLAQPFFPMSGEVEGVDIPLIGREAEIDTLRDMLVHTARVRQSGLVTLIGEAGVGKTRLAREFHGRLESFRYQTTIFLGRADQRQAGVSFSLLRDLLVRHFAIEDIDQAGIVEEKIIRRLAEAWPIEKRKATETQLRRQARAIAALVGLGQPALNPDRPGVFDAAADRSRAIESLLHYFEAVIRASEVAVIFLDDIHWADEDSLALLGRVASAAAGHPLLTICLTRPALLERWPDWPGENKAGSLSLPVRPLSDAASRALLAAILRKLPQVPPALSELLVRAAAGNPFFVEEMVRVLIEDGVIISDQPSWYLRSRELTRLRVPGTLTGVLQARLDRLPELERAVLQQAAVVGDEFWEGAVQQINRAARFPFSEDQVRAALYGLERRDMILRAPTRTISRSQGYLFKHTVLREVAYESVLLRDRPGYHLQAVRWLETQIGERAADYTALIAYHYEHASRPADAARMYELAATHAAEQFKLTTAIDYCRKVLDLMRHLPQLLDTRLAVKEQLGQLLQQRGRMIEALDVYKVMLDSAELDGNLLAQTRSLIARAAIFLELDDVHRAYEAAARAGPLARLTGADLEWSRAQLLQGEAAARLGERDEAARALREGIEQAGILDAPRLMARGLGLLATLTDPPDGHGQAIGALRVLVDELEESDAIEDAAYALVNLGKAYLAAEDYSPARYALERALTWQRPTGSQRAVAESLQLLAIAACRSGEATQAMAYVEEAASLAELTGNRYLWLACRLVMGETLLAQKQLAAAEATLRQVITTAEDRRRLGTWIHLPRARRLLASALRAQGRLDEVHLVEENIDPSGYPT